MKSFEEMLRECSTDWVHDGVITAPQREAILARHPAEVRTSRFVAILTTLGGLLLAVGISLIIKSNWQQIGDWVKISGVVVLMLTAYGTGWWLKEGRGGYPKTGDSLLMVGALLFLCGIALVSQIFHLNSRPASGVMVWCLGITAIPWLVRAKGAQFVSLVAWFVWLGMEMVARDSWIYLGSSKNETVLLSFYFLAGVALWMSGLALAKTRWAVFSGMHELWGLIVMGSVLYLYGFWRHLTRFNQPELDWAQSPVLGVALLLVVAFWIPAWRKAASLLKATGPWLLVALVPVVAVPLGFDLGDRGWLWSAWSWVSLFILSVVVIRQGIETHRESWVNLGILFVALNVVTRYFDLFGTMLEGGVFFLLSGALVLVLGIFLEKQRRRLLKRLRETEVSA
jgi:uncharacterized membrane protein